MLAGMGIGLRFAGTLEEPARAAEVAALLGRRAEELGWDPVPATAGGDGGSVGFLLPGGGTLSLRLGPGGALEGEAETARAGPEVHRAACLLLVEIAHAFDAPLEVEDDAGYWDRWDDRALRAVWKGEGGAEGYAARARERRLALRHLAASALGVVAMLAAGIALVEAFTGSLLDGRWWILLSLAAYFASGALRPREGRAS